MAITRLLSKQTIAHGAATVAFCLLMSAAAPVSAATIINGDTQSHTIDIVGEDNARRSETLAPGARIERCALRAAW